LDELQAAILRVKLKYLEQWNEERRKRALSYKRALESAEVSCPSEKEQARHVYHLFVIRAKKRGALQAFLKGKGIETLIHYPTPIHLQKAYRELGYQRGDLPVTERQAQEILSLPFFPELTGEEMREVTDKIRSFVEGQP
jgi:dTDP-4-amino-4,6-dideoxygalactose transaminase